MLKLDINRKKEIKTWDCSDCSEEKKKKQVVQEAAMVVKTKPLDLLFRKELSNNEIIELVDTFDGQRISSTAFGKTMRDGNLTEAAIYSFDGTGRMKKGYTKRSIILPEIISGGVYYVKERSLKSSTSVFTDSNSKSVEYLSTTLDIIKTQEIRSILVKDNLLFIAVITDSKYDLYIDRYYFFRFEKILY